MNLDYWENADKNLCLAVDKLDFAYFYDPEQDREYRYYVTKQDLDNLVNSIKVIL